MTINYDRFKNLLRIDKCATMSEATKFIHEGSMATSVNNNGTDYCAGFIYDNREDVDRALLYIEKFNEQYFNIGDIFAWDDYHYIIIDKDKIVKNVGYCKYVCYECNSQIDDIWGYLKGPKTNYINTTIKSELAEISQAKPVFITNTAVWKIGDKILIKGRPWRVNEIDDYSTNGIYYYSLEATTMPISTSEAATTKSLQLKTTNDIIEVKPLQTITIKTEDQYFVCNKTIFTSIKDNIVTLTVPFGLKDFELAFKVQGVVEKQKYKVVM